MIPTIKYYKMEAWMTLWLSVRELSKEFNGIKAVDNVSFEVCQGEVLGFLGPNGAGKSTTMRMITGFLPCDSGSINVCGYNIKTDAIAAQKLIGYLPEGGPLYNDMTPNSFLRFIGRSRGINDKKLIERLDYVVEVLHLEQVFYQTIDTLSKGFKRRVALAQAILHNPKMLILDEPTDGLDPNQKYEVQQLIKAMAKDKSIIISTHILEEVEAVCTKAMIIAKGKILLSGTPEELARHSPHHNSVVVTFDNEPTEQMMNAFLNLDNVNDVKANNDNNIVITPKAGQIILADVNKIVHMMNWPVSEIYSKPGQLRDAFRKITN